MSHNISMNRQTRQYNFTRRAGSVAAWHGLGKETKTQVIADWIFDADLDYSLEKVPMFIQREDTIDVGGFSVPVNRLIQSNDGYALRRSDTGAFLCSIGPNTHVLQNRFAFTSFQPFLDAKLAEMDCAMGLDNDKRIVVTAKVIGATMEIIKGDAIECYIALAHAHDNSLSVHSMLTPTRIVCQNTLRMAIDDERSRIVKIRHGRDVETRVSEAQANIADAIALFRENCEQVYKPMSRTPINEKGAIDYFKRVFKMEPNKETGVLATRTQNTLDSLLAALDRNTRAASDVLDLAKEMRQIEEKQADEKAQEYKSLLEMCLSNMEAGKGAEIPNVRGTVWGAYNAVTEVLTHDKGRSPQSLINSNLFGPNAKTNDKALDIAMEYVSAGTAIA